MNAAVTPPTLASNLLDHIACVAMRSATNCGVGQLRSISMISGSLKPCATHLALAAAPCSVGFHRSSILL
eukprot:6396831-Pyramimonas_sp.AAC.1